MSPTGTCIPPQLLEDRNLLEEYRLWASPRWILAVSDYPQDPSKITNCFKLQIPPREHGKVGNYLNRDAEA